MAVSMGVARDLVDYFLDKQTEFKVRDNPNVLNARWDMQAIADHIDDIRRVRMLIRYFFRTSHQKTFKDFFANYNEYLEDMDQVLAQYEIDKHLIEETLKGQID